MAGGARHERAAGGSIRRGVALALAALTLGMSGCNLLGFVGALEEQRRRHSKKWVDPEYEGLAEKSYAVIIVADRAVEMDMPWLVRHLTGKINEAIKSNVDASGWIPTDDLLVHLYQNPRWIALSYSALAEDLGVERLVIVRLDEFRLYEPGNQYLWSGVAAGVVGVVEADGPIPDELTFQRVVRVAFPDKSGMGPTDYSEREVTAVLAARFTDRASWLFYRHQEPYYPDY
jgi:hypothetical protein